MKNQLIILLFLSNLIYPASAAEVKTQVLRFYSESGRLVEEISYLRDFKGRMVRHGNSVEYGDFSTMISKYRNGVLVGISHKSNDPNDDSPKGHAKQGQASKKK